MTEVQSDVLGLGPLVRGALDPWEGCVALLMAGGPGTRLRPLCDEVRTKPFVRSAATGTSLLRTAFTSLPRTLRGGRTFVSTAAHARAAVLAELPEVRPAHVDAEPVRRDTAASLARSMAFIETQTGRRDLIVLVLACDHHVDDVDAYRRALARAVELARTTHGVVSIGVPASRAETRFGYMRVGADARCLEYVEKPSKIRAEALARTGAYAFNTGAFVFATDTFFRACREADATLGAWFDAYRSRFATLDADDDRLCFTSLPSRSFDHAVMEHIGRDVSSHVVVGDFGWDDLGTFDALRRAGMADEGGSAHVGTATSSGSSASLLVADEGIALQGEGLVGEVVVARDDTVYVAPIDRAAPPDCDAPVCMDVVGKPLVAVTRRGHEVRVVRRPSLGISPDARQSLRAVAPTRFDAVLGDAVARAIEETLARRERALVTFSTGETTRGAFAHLADTLAHRVDVRRIDVVQMDEWLGLDTNDARCAANDLERRLFSRVAFGSVHAMKSLDDALCIAALAHSRGGIDVALHGIGTNGHLGFNEPGTDLHADAHVVPLAASTRDAFTRLHGGDAPTHGVTLGLHALTTARHVVLAARGSHKASAIARLLEGPSDACFPASRLIDHPRLDVVVDTHAMGLAR